MTKTYAAESNTYVKNLDATGAASVEYTRNPKAFQLPQYCEYKPVSKNSGYYLNIDDEEAARMTDATNMQDDLWADGNDAPSGNQNKVGFEYLDYRTLRRATAWRIGDLAERQADWQILMQYGRIFAQQRMTRRTQLCATVLQTAGNWASTNKVAAPTAITGVTGLWDVSTTARSDIKRTIEYACEQIMLMTLGLVDPSQLVLIMSPGCARKISTSQEIVDYLKGSPDAMAQLRGDPTNPNTMFGLPKKLYGVDILVERTVKVTNKKAATRASSFVFADASPVIVRKPEAIREIGEFAESSAPTLSTVTAFIYEDFSVEEKRDESNRLTTGRIVDDLVFKLTSGASGFLIGGAVT